MRFGIPKTKKTTASIHRPGRHRPVRRGQEHGCLDAPLGHGNRNDCRRSRPPPYFHDSARGPDIRGRGTRSLYGTPVTAWLLHWHLCGEKPRPRGSGLFIITHSISFEREALVPRDSQARRRAGVASCICRNNKEGRLLFIRTYVSQTPSATADLKTAGIAPNRTRVDQVHRSPRWFPIRTRAEAVSRAWRIRLRSNRLLATEFPQRQHFVLRSA